VNCFKLLFKKYQNVKERSLANVVTGNEHWFLFISKTKNIKTRFGLQCQTKDFALQKEIVKNRIPKECPSRQNCKMLQARFD
jgi:hypothetical protein